MKKAVIFDLDGTLVHSLPDIAAAMNRSLAACGLPVFPEDDYRYKVGNGVLTLTKRCVGERTDLYDRVLQLYKTDYALHSQVLSRPFPGVPELLRTLNRRGVKVCVLTNKDQSDAENVLSFYFPDVLFSAVRGRIKDVPLKPDPAGALLIADQLGVSPKDCWYVGDTGTDMACGNAAGMETVGVLWGYRPIEELRQFGAEHIAARPEELLALFTE